MNIKANFSWSAPALVLVGCALSGCAVPLEGSLDDPQDTLEATGTTEEGLRTSAPCGSVPADATVALGLRAGSTSDRTYGTALCPRRYVVEVTGMAGKDFTASAAWGDTFLDEATCKNAAVRANVLVQLRVEDQLIWVAGEDRVAAGTWLPRSATQLIPVCSLGVKFGPVTGAPYARMRVAAEAFLPSLIFDNGRTIIPQPRAVRVRVFCPRVFCLRARAERAPIGSSPKPIRLGLHSPTSRTCKRSLPSMYSIAM